MVIFINQLRMKIGVMFGSPETTTGGNALKFYSSVRLDIRRIGAIKTTDKVVGNRTRVKVVKNKMAPPFREIEFDITYGEGISREGMLIDLGVAANVVDKAGAWLSYRGDRIGQGRENAKAFLKENPEICRSIEAEVLKANDIQREVGGAPADGGAEGAAAGAKTAAPAEAEAASKSKKNGASNGASRRGRARA